MGLGAETIRDRGGADGAGVAFADLEAGGFALDHPALGAERIRLISRDPGGRTRPRAQPTGLLARTTASDLGHGTRVLGAVLGRGFGGVNPACGVAPGVTRAFAVSCGTVDRVASAVRIATLLLEAGDVLLLEMELVDPDAPHRVFPIELDDHVYTAIRAATDRGVVVVEPAGNGGRALETLDLDGTLPFDPRSPSWRDSGAIMVGALERAPGASGLRSALRSSGFGARVDTSAPGEGIPSADVGRGGVPVLSEQLGGTSGAAALVAGVCLVIQGVARARTGAPLSPRTLRARLRDPRRGTATHPARPVGPMPDLARLLDP